jgi:hypothetical protein
MNVLIVSFSPSLVNILQNDNSAKRTVSGPGLGYTGPVAAAPHRHPHRNPEHLKQHKE